MKRDEGEKGKKIK